MNKDQEFDFYFVYNDSWKFLSKKKKVILAFEWFIVMKKIHGIGSELEYIQDG